METLQNIGLGIVGTFIIGCWLFFAYQVFRLILVGLVYLKLRFISPPCEENCAPMIKPAVVESALNQQKNSVLAVEDVAPQLPIRRVPEGLERSFRKGEFMPWKKIQFMVKSVTPREIILVPIDTTNAFKKRQARHAA